jgi:hypothetical protein
MAFSHDSEDSQPGVTKKADWPYGVAPKTNSPTRSLLGINAMNGWPDPMKIVDVRTGKSEDISLWDHAKTAGTDGSWGDTVPTNDPPKEYYGRDANAIDPTGGPTMKESITFNYPEVSREARVSGKPKRTLSDPDPGNF